MKSRSNSPRSSRTRAALLVNMIAPARIPLFSALADHFDLLILHGGMEANRSWHGVEGALPNATVKRAAGWQIPTWRKNDGVEDRRYVHFTPGFLWHLLRFRPRVVVANEMGFRAVAALLYGALTRTPVWLWWGGTLHTERGIGRLRKISRALISRWARHWISYGLTSTEYLLSLGIDRSRILEIQNAVDEQRFSTRPSAGASGEGTDLVYRVRPVILCVSALIPRKGLDCLLRAAAALKREGREFSLAIIGTGPELEGLQRLAKDARLTNIFFHPERPPEEMPAVYRSADIFVFPTLEDVWGMVANEAVLSGLDVLCSCYAGCAPELFDPQNIFDPRNPEQFKDKLRDALDGLIAPSDPSRLKTTPQLAATLIRALEDGLPGGDRSRSSGIRIVQKREGASAPTAS